MDAPGQNETELLHTVAGFDNAGALSVGLARTQRKKLLSDDVLRQNAEKYVVFNDFDKIHRGAFFPTVH